MANNQKRIIWILSLVIAVLVLVGVYFLVLQPQKTTYDNNKRLEGMNIAIGSILQGVQAQGFTQIPISGNQSVILAYVTPEELQFLNQVRQQQAKQPNPQQEAA